MSTPDSCDIRKTARSYFEETVSPAHDWHHVRRVERLAKTLGDQYEAADPTILELAALLHDIGRGREDRGKIDDHARWGAREARRLLADAGVDADRIEAVCHAIRTHRYSSGPEPETLDARLLSDADNLDALGAVGIARCFTYGGERGQVVYDPDGPRGAEARTTYEHFEAKILTLPGRMYTDAGRRLAAERVDVVECFLDRLEREVAGVE